VGLVIGFVVGLVTGLLSSALLERLQRPRISITPGHWDQSGFAHVAVTNKRGGYFARRPMTACEASLEFVRAGVSVLHIPARWSGAPEPSFPSDIPLSYRWDLASTGIPQQIAIARTGSGGRAYAFSAEGYFARPQWEPEEWRLDPGEYDVVVRLAASEGEHAETFRLVVAQNGSLKLGAPLTARSSANAPRSARTRQEPDGALTRTGQGSWSGACALAGRHAWCFA
jgi:hypothetical protein